MKYLGKLCPRCASPVRYISCDKCVECVARRGVGRKRGPEGPRPSRFAKSKRHWPSYTKALESSS